MNKQFLHISFALLIGGGILLCEGCTDNLSENLNVRKGVTLTAIGSSDPDLVPEGTDDAGTKGYWSEKNGKNGVFYWNDPSETLSAAVYGTEDWSTINVDGSSRTVEVTATRGATIGNVTGNNRQAALTCTVAKTSVSEGDYIYYTNGAVSAENPSSVTFSMPDAFTQNNGTNSGGVAPMFIYGSGKINSESESGISAGGIVFKQVCATFCMDLKNNTASEIALGKVKISVQTPTGSNDLAVFPKEYSMTVDPSTDTFTLNENEAAGRYSEVETSLNSSNNKVAAGATYYTYFLTLPTTITDAVFVVKAYINGQYKTLKKVRVSNLTTQSGYIYHLPIDITDTNIAASDDDYYKDFMSDKGIEIGGYTYKASDFDGVQIYQLDSDSNCSITGDGIYFVSEGVEATVTTNTNRAVCLVIGRSKTAKSKLTLKNNALRFLCKAGNTKSHMVLFNLDFDATQFNSGAAIQALLATGDVAGGYIERLSIDACDVKLHPSQSLITANTGPTASETAKKVLRSINNINIINSKINVPVISATSYHLILATYNSNYPNIVIKNNIFWARESTSYIPFNFGNSITTGTELTNVDISNNTFVNIVPAGNGNILQCRSLQNATISNNLMYAPLSAYKYIVRMTYDSAKTGVAPTTLTADNNWSLNATAGNSQMFRIYYLKTATDGCKFTGHNGKEVKNANLLDGWDVASGYFPIKDRTTYGNAGSTIDD